ncbi:hypothetical protein M758_12G057400 [Ceratodon purpureus]|nr:hypothetical protein M758_12G057400 [Ceratodon purpureus]
MVYTLYPHCRFVHLITITAENSLSSLSTGAEWGAGEHQGGLVPSSSSSYTSIQHRELGPNAQVVDFLYRRWVEAGGCVTSVLASKACGYSTSFGTRRSLWAGGDVSRYSPLTLSGTFFDVSRAHRIISVLKTRKHLAVSVNKACVSDGG